MISKVFGEEKHSASWISTTTVIDILVEGSWLMNECKYLKFFWSQN